MPESTTAPCLSIHSLSKSFPQSPRPALSDVSLEVEKHQIVAVIGSSGSGKTTLLRLIAGLESPTEGSILLNGTRIASPQEGMPPEERNIGMMFQDYVLFPHFTVEKNIAFGISHLSKTEQKKRITQLMQSTQLTEEAHRLPHELSGGQMQRVALARALAPQSPLILMDEPFNSLDLFLKESVILLMRKILHESGVATLFVTHDRDEAFSLADKIILLHEGKIIQRGAPKEIYTFPQSEFSARFLGKTNIIPARQNHKGIETPLGLLPLSQIHNRLDTIRSVIIRPHMLELRSTPPFNAQVEYCRFYGTYTEIQVSFLALPSCTAIIHTVPEMTLSPHQQCHVGVNTTTPLMAL